MLLVTGIVVVLSLPSIQTGLALRFTKSLQEKTNTNWQITKIKIDLLGNINFNGVIGMDHHQDTLFYIDQFQARLVDAGQALNGSILFDAARLKGFDLRLKQYEGDSLTNLAYFIQRLNLHSEPKQTGNQFIINNLLFSEGSILIEHPAFGSKPIQLKALAFGMPFFQVRSNKWQGTLSNLSFESDHWGSVKSLSTSFQRTVNKIAIDSFSLNTATSHVDGFANIVVNPRSQSIDSLALNVYANSLDLKDLGWDEYYPNPLRATITGKGTLDAFQMDSLFLESDAFKLQSSARIALDSRRNFKNINLSIDTLNFSSSLFRTEAIRKLLPAAWQKINPSIPFVFSGTSSITTNHSSLEGILHQEKGQLTIQASLFKKKEGIETASAQLKAANWNIKNIISTYPLHQMDGLLQLSFQRQNKKIKELRWKSSFGHIAFDQQPIVNINSEGEFEKGQWKGFINSNDPLLQGAFQFLVEPQNTMAINTFQLQINKLDLGLFHSFSGFGKSQIKGIVKARFTGFQPDDINGNFQFSDWIFTNPKESVSFDDFILQSHTKNLYRTLAIVESDLIQGSIRGNYKLSQLGQLLQNTLSRAYPFVVPLSFKSPQNALVDVLLSKKALRGVLPEWNIEKDFTIKGLLHADPGLGRLNLNAPFLKYKNTVLQGLVLALKPESESQSNIFYADRFEFKTYVFDSLSIVSSSKKDGLFLDIKARGGPEKNDNYHLQALHTVVPDKELRFQLYPSTIRFKGNNWELSESSPNAATLQYRLNDKALVVGNFSATSGEQKIRGSGFYASKNSFSVEAELDSVDLKSVLPSQKNFRIGGVLSSRLKAIRSTASNDFQFTSQIERLILNQEPMGRLDLESNGNTQLGTYNINLNLAGSGRKKLIVAGTLYNGSEGPNLNLDLDFDRFELDFLNPLAKGSLDFIRGEASGSANLWGPLSQLRHDGRLRLTKSGLQIPYINVNYSFSDRAEVALTNQSFTFSRVPFEDNRFDTKGVLSGTFSHQNFKNWSLDFDLASDRILIFDLEESPERIFYGQGYFGGSGKLKGPTKSLHLTLDGQTQKGTDFKIPWTDDYGLVDTSFIDFISKKEGSEQGAVQTRPKAAGNVFEMDFELDVTNDATIEIVIDPETNSSLSGKGVGTLLMEINTDDKFNMWGDFLTTEGIYNFKNLGLIDKKFNLQPGGTVSWEGDPLGAQMNMEAIYAVPGGANPALLLDNPNFNRKIPTEVAIRLQGNLLQPDDPSFSIAFPNTNNVVVSEINYRLADPQRSQLQAISLLSQGVFISDVSVSVQGITNNLYEKASDVLSSLLGESDEKLKVGVNYLQGDRNNEMAIETEDRLGLTLSTQISDKILVNGKIGVPVGGVVQTQVVGDVQIDFILNEDGTLRAKVFNKENEFRYIGEDFGYTQGVGLSYDVDFNSFRELIQKIKKRAYRDSIQKSSISQEAPSIVEFRNKNKR
ncbi:MAG: translocation/assembly module TamB domain-containing protein [Flavobacteriaceae bacterium]